MENKFTSNKVRNLGQELRKNLNTPNPELLVELQEYRTSHKNTLSETFQELRNCSRTYSGAIVTYRLKRIDSILSKLRREPNMKLDRMGDIAGCRCIVSDEKAKRALISVLHKRFPDSKFKDYTYEPKQSGYKSYHIYAKSHNGSNHTVEIQIRTVDEHNWATLVEIIDLLYNKKVKEGESEKKLERFHYLLSDKLILSIEDKREILSIVDDYKIHQTLRNMFKRNYLDVRIQWTESRTGSSYSYFIIEASKNEVPKITSYRDFTAAESEYFQKFLKNKDNNIVLTHIPKANYTDIEKAYSNYILTMHSFLDDYLVILESILSDCIRNRQALAYSKYFKTYLKTINDLTTDVRAEDHAIGNYIQFRQKRNKEVRKWQAEFRNRFIKYRTGINKFGNNVSTLYPKKGFTKTKFDLITSILVRWYSFR